MILILLPGTFFHYHGYFVIDIKTGNLASNVEQDIDTDTIIINFIIIITRIIIIIIIIDIIMPISTMLFSCYRYFCAISI